MLFPGASVAGPLFVIERSACAPIDVATVELLLPEFGSFAPELTDAVLLNEVPLKFAGTLYVAVMVAVWPALIVPRLQGKALLHAPLFETNVRPAGVVSLTTTAAAADGPAFVTVIV